MVNLHIAEKKNNQRKTTVIVRTHLKNSFIYELEDAINKEGYDFEKCFNFKVHVTEGYYYAGWYEKMDLILEDYHTAVIQVSDLAEKCSDELF